MEIIKKHLTNGQYLTREYEKTSIFLHHTVGLTAEGAWSWWNQTPERVGTPYIIDRNGVIIECFDPKVWAYHLGIKGDDNYQEMYSVSIELVAGGRLYKEGNIFKFYPLYPNKLYYTIIPTEDVHIMKEPWRGHLYYHKYTIEQLLALKELLRFIFGLFPKMVITSPLNYFYEYNENVILKKLPGLWSHSTVRPDKDDIFPYPPLLKSLEEVIESFNIPKEEPKTSIKPPKLTSTKPKKPKSRT